MWTDGHDAYLESRVLTADPIELVNLLYQACTEAVRGARRSPGGRPDRGTFARDQQSL